MKYEFIVLDDTFKNNTQNIYKENNNVCINLTNLFNENRNLKYPVGIFINGVLLDSIHYKFKSKVIKISENYPVYTSDRIYMILTSSSLENSGYIIQYKLNDFKIVENDSIELLESLVDDTDNRVIAIIINGVVYSKELFELNGNIVKFNKYVPNVEDDVSALIIRK